MYSHSDVQASTPFPLRLWQHILAKYASFYKFVYTETIPLPLIILFIDNSAVISFSNSLNMHVQVQQHVLLFETLYFHVKLRSIVWGRQNNSIIKWGHGTKNPALDE